METNKNESNVNEGNCDNAAFELAESSMTEKEMDRVFYRAMAKYCPMQYKLWKAGYELKRVGTN